MLKTQDYNQALKIMKLNAQEKNHTLISCESVGAGHPDKMADQISDVVLDAFLAQDPSARVAVETAVKDSEVMLFGEVNSNALSVYGQLPELIRSHITENIGYNCDEMGFNGKTCSISLRIGQQANEIEMGTQNAENVGANSQGAGDQGIMYGYATNETEERMPLPIMLAHKVVNSLNSLMHLDSDHGLRPDNKAMVTVEYDAVGKAVRIASFVVAQQHNPDVTRSDIEELVRITAKEITPNGLLDENTIFIINGTGSFIVGGPLADLRPSSIIELLNLKQVKYLPTATYGHFGCPEYPWEKVVSF